MRHLLSLLLLLPLAAWSANLPPYLTLPPALHPNGNADSVTIEEFGEAEFPVQDADPAVYSGEHWIAGLVFDGIPDDQTPEQMWPRLRAPLLAGGWTVVAEWPAATHGTFRYQKNGKDAWADFAVFGSTDIRLNVVEIRPQPMKFALPPPAASPEAVSADSGDFPYLMPLPGSQRGGSAREDGALFVSLPGLDDPQMVATGSIIKYYSKPGVSNLQFVTVYAQALQAAGWSIVTNSHGIHQSDAVLIAHYTARGRDIWANLHHTGDDYSVQVADAGGNNLSAELARSCHAALYGVFFDFNKDTLKPESESTLRSALAALKGTPALAIEVQGHTDNVGGDDYNMKLSDARANTVMHWLVANGIPAAQLTAKGYGKTRPVASNDTDDGRARNRRVELACRK